MLWSHGQNNNCRLVEAMVDIPEDRRAIAHMTIETFYASMIETLWKY